MYKKEIILSGTHPHFAFEELCIRINQWHVDNFHSNEECHILIKTGEPNHISFLGANQRDFWYTIDLLIHFYNEESYNLFKLTFNNEYEVWKPPKGWSQLCAPINY